MEIKSRSFYGGCKNDGHNYNYNHEQAALFLDKNYLKLIKDFLYIELSYFIFFAVVTYLADK